MYRGKGGMIAPCVLDAEHDGDHVASAYDGVIVAVCLLAAKLGLVAIGPQTMLPLASVTAYSAAARLASRVPELFACVVD